IWRRFSLYPLPSARAPARISPTRRRFCPIRARRFRGHSSAVVAMERTPVSLLVRLRQPSDAEAWRHFVDLYTPLLYCWARRLGMQVADAGDLVQEVLIVLVQKLPEFSYDRHKRFRGWLWTITRNKWRDSRRKQVHAPVPASDAPLPDQAAPEEVGLE